MSGNDLKPPVVFLDTSILRKFKLGSLPAEFRVLRNLARHGKIRLCMSETNHKEWLSHLISSPITALNNYKKAYKALSNNYAIKRCTERILLSPHLTTSESALNKLEASAIAKVQNDICNCNIEIVAHTPACYTSAFDDYYKGAAPYKAIRSRKDIPDSLIYQSLKKVAEHSSILLFACDDTGLCSAAEGIGVKCFHNLESILQDEGIANLQGDPEFALWWEHNAGQVCDAAEHACSTNQELLHDLIDDQLRYNLIEDPCLPSDNHDAWINGIAHVIEINTRSYSFESLGEGIITFPATLSLWADLDFEVHADNIDNLPHWANQSTTQPDQHGYFSADGICRIEYELDLIFEYPASGPRAPIDPELITVSIGDTHFIEIA